MHTGRTLMRGLALLALPATLMAQGELPLKRTPTKTSPEISAQDLMSYLYAFADDSMGGRASGTPYNVKGTAWIAAHAKRIGLEPAGDNGTYFQDIPLVRMAFDTTSTVRIGELSQVIGKDFTVFAAPGAEPKPFSGGQGVYGGGLDSATWISADAAVGKVVVINATLMQANQALGTLLSTKRFAGAAAVVLPFFDQVPPPIRARLSRASITMKDAKATAQPPIIIMGTKAADALVGGAVASATPGAVGATASGSVSMTAEPLPARNVAGILRGSDPKLKHQYVVIGAHNDHIEGGAAVDHDSLRAFNSVVRPGGADSPMRQPTAEERTKIAALLDSLRAKRPARRDSIANGADDDGSGSVTVLEVAEAMVAMKQKPKRSVLFLWYTAEERGLFGSQFYTEHPTVPRDSMVAAINMDMVGRGAATDMVVTDAGKERYGNPTYLQLVGSRRLSTQYGDLIEAMNKKRKTPFEFDYTYDADGHPQNIYCRSDHYNFARWGIPVVFFTTGLHRDYHQVTDEPQYIDYPHMAEVAKFARDVVLETANMPGRPVVDKPKPDPYGACKQ